MATLRPPQGSMRAGTTSASQRKHFPFPLRVTWARDRYQAFSGRSWEFCPCVSPSAPVSCDARHLLPLCSGDPADGRLRNVFSRSRVSLVGAGR